MRVYSSPNAYQQASPNRAAKGQTHTTHCSTALPTDQFTASPAPSVRFAGERHTQAMQQHIAKGLKLIRNGQYDEAMLHFSNKAALKKMGITLIYGPVNMLESIPTTPEAVKAALSWVEKKNWFKNHDTIQLSQLVFAKNGEELEPQTPEERKALRQLQHEQALMYAEEHLHALQEMQGGNLTYHPSTPAASDHEIDIATTLAKLDVPLTEPFLKRYKRAEHVPNYLKATYG